MAALLLGAYYVVPHFLREGDGTTGIQPGRIEAITLAVPNGEGFHLRRTSADWIIDDRRETRADPSQVNSLLDGLASARLDAPGETPEVDWAAAPELRLVPRRGRDVVLQLGPRVRPLRSQLVRLNREVHKISFDVSASLGLWEGEFIWDGNRLLDRIPILIEGEEIVSIRLENLFSDYILDRTDRIVHRREDQDGGQEPLYRWTSGGSHSDRDPSPAAMSRFARGLMMLVVDGIPTGSTPDSEVARTVTFTTDAGRTFEVATGKPHAEDARRMLWLRQPEPSDAYLVDDRFLQRFTPHGAPLFENRPTFSTGASDAAMITYERDGHKLVLEREPGQDWRITRPQIPYDIFTPPPDPALPPGSMADIYASVIDSIRTEEFFVPDTGERRELIDGVFDEPALRLVVEDRIGRQTEILLSDFIAGTRRVLASMNGDIGVLSDHYVRTLAPDIRFFLNPAEVHGRTIEW